MQSYSETPHPNFSYYVMIARLPLHLPTYIFGLEESECTNIIEENK